MKKVTVIIPVYNEEKSIVACLNSLNSQSYQNMEVIAVDDGSTDKTVKIISNLKSLASVKALAGRQISRQRRGSPSAANLKVLHQNHKGPGSARNLGASKSTGEILIFVDADMTFDKNFIKKLTNPIIKGKTIGTFSKDEYVENPDNIWSICWNLNKNLNRYRMIPKNYPNSAPVFRAILKKDFERVGGFEISGQYTDDWSLSKKLGIESSVAPGAIYYHTNPASLKEIWHQARWIGKSDFISGNLLRTLRSLLIYNPVTSTIIGLYKSAVHQNFYFLIFKLVYDIAIFSSVVKSFSNKAKSK